MLGKVPGLFASAPSVPLGHHHNTHQFIDEREACCFLPRFIDEREDCCFLPRRQTPAAAFLLSVTRHAALKDDIEREKYVAIINLNHMEAPGRLHSPRSAPKMTPDEKGVYVPVLIASRNP